MTAVEIIALVTIILSVIKLVTVYINPKAWYEGPIARIWTRPVAGTVISLALGVVILNYLLQELTIVQVFASVAFASVLFSLMLIPYYKELHGIFLKDGQSGDQIFKKSWLGTVAWVALMVWALVEIFT
jgi:hypothetical protein